MAVISMKQLLEAGVHFGHQTRRWNPKMAKYIFTERNGIYIIDLQKTVKKVDEAFAFVRSVAEEGKTILFVGTKKQAQEAVKEEAIRAGQFFVNERWLGGMLTNFQTIQKRIGRLKELEEMEADGTFDVLTKKEVMQLRHEMARLEKYLGGIKEMNKIPGALFIVDPRKERIAVAEARKLGVPIVAIVDTNCDPDEIMSFQVMMMRFVLSSSSPHAWLMLFLKVARVLMLLVKKKQLKNNLQVQLLNVKI